MGTTTMSAAAETQGALWSARVADWVGIQERLMRPLYESALDRARVGAGTHLLDAGCGGGLACVIAVGRGATVSGLDAAAGLLAAAREQLPQGDFRHGEIEALPWADGTFDVTTGFNAFQYATDPTHALAEARRVTKPGGSVVIATWGLPEQCEAAGHMRALGQFLPPPPPGAPGPFALSTPGALEALASAAGLTPVAATDVACPLVYPDEETALRGLLSAGVVVRAINRAGEDAVREAVAASIAAYRTPSGSYHLNNVFRYLIATA